MVVGFSSAAAALVILSGALIYIRRKKKAPKSRSSFLLNSNSTSVRQQMNIPVRTSNIYSAPHTYDLYTATQSSDRSSLVKTGPVTSGFTGTMTSVVGGGPSISCKHL